MLNAGPHWEKYTSSRELIETAGMITSLQFLVALITLNWLVPRFLNQQKMLLFWLLLFMTLVVVSEINIVIRVFYLEPTYPQTYQRFLDLYGHMSPAERMSLAWSLRYIIFSKLPLFLFPSAILIAYDFYQKQQSLLRLKEQKKSAELDALKNQLNPHFIFNTLNNIYSLALKKSDQTPVAIEQLSAILDYIVYRCDKQYVALESEISLIENYIALEKIRYGERLQIDIQNTASRGHTIAPLILLTLLENACKHSTREELNQAQVSISIRSNRQALEIEVGNSKPESQHNSENQQDKVGLANLKRQLALLYPNRHEISIENKAHSYTTKLTLRNP